jgi:hypothetical protein
MKHEVGQTDIYDVSNLCSLPILLIKMHDKEDIHSDFSNYETMYMTTISAVRH